MNHAYQEFHQGCLIFIPRLFSEITLPLLFLRLLTSRVYFPGETFMYLTDPFSTGLFHSFSYPFSLYW